MKENHRSLRKIHRKAEGLFLKWSIKQNISLPYLYEKTKCFISSKWEKDEGNKYIDKFLIKGLIDDNRNFNLHIKVDEQENILGIDYNLEKIINKK